MTNFERAHLYFREYESPELYITWDLLYAVASCLGRKVWCGHDNPIFPNIFVVIVGPPSIGKSMPAIQLYDILAGLQKQTKNGDIEDLINIAPDCVTLEKLYSFLEKCGDAIQLPPGQTPPKWKPTKPDDKIPPYFHSSASFLLGDEMGLLFKKSDKTKDTILFLNTGYDNKQKFKYETKTKGFNVVTNLCVNFFGCCTNNWIADNLSSNVIDEGWASRAFFVWGDERRQYTTFFNFLEDQHTAWGELKKHFGEIAKLCGLVKLTPEAYEFFDNWYQTSEGGKKFRINTDNKLEYYYGRKKIHVIKLAMLFHFLEHTTMEITVEDLKKALKLLAETEANMHKALASVNANPTAKLAESFVAEIKSGGAKSKAELVAKFYGQAIGGMAAIDEALIYLRDTQQIQISSGGKYDLVKKVVEVDFKKPIEPKKTTDELKDEIIKASQA